MVGRLDLRVRKAGFLRLSTASWRRRRRFNRKVSGTLHACRCGGPVAILAEWWGNVYDVFGPIARDVSRGSRIVALVFLVTFR